MLIQGNEQRRHVSSNTPWFSYGISIAGGKSEGTTVKLGKYKVEFIHEFLDSWPMPVRTVSRPLKRNGSPRTGDFSRNLDIGIPNLLECGKVFAQVCFSTGFLAVYLLPRTTAGARN